MDRRSQVRGFDLHELGWLEAAIFSSEPTGVWVAFRSSESVIPTMMLNVFTHICIHMFILYTCREVLPRSLRTRWWILKLWKDKATKGMVSKNVRGKKTSVFADSADWIRISQETESACYVQDNMVNLCKTVKEVPLLDCFHWCPGVAA